MGMKEPEVTNSKRRLPSLDGWRALSILLVFFSHIPYAKDAPDYLSNYLQFFDGNLGVRIFFIISGFIITYIICGSINQNEFSYKNFIYNRAIRILPGFYSYIIACIILQLFGLIYENSSSWLGCFLFIRNFLGRGDSLTIHFWSLSIEEQFYLFFPFIFAFSNKRLSFFLFLTFIFFSIFLRFLNVTNDYSVYGRLVGGRSTFLYLDSILIGTLYGHLYYLRHKN